MPRAAHHVTCATEDPDAVIEFLGRAMGLQVTSELRASGATTTNLLGWPPCDGVRGWMLGSGPGAIEVLEIPESLRGQVAPGISLISFAVSDLADGRTAADAIGVSTSEPVLEQNDTVDATASSAVVGGIRFELISFNPAVAPPE